MSQNLIVLSFDAIQSSDLDILLKLPNFSKIAKKISVVRSNYEIYPTLTYPIHATILTGVYPDAHGIFHNQKPSFDPAKPQWLTLGADWYFEKKDLKVPTLVDASLEKGHSVATILWPSTAGEKRGYNLPQIWLGRDKNIDQKQLYERASSPNIFSRYFDDYISHYDISDPLISLTYGIEIALDILRTYRPNLLLGYVFYMDHVRHVYGDKTNETLECLRQLDIILGRFIQAASEIGTLENTNFVILGDHGQIDVENLLYLNVILQEYGLIITDGAGNVKSYDAYSFSTGFSTQINAYNHDDMKVKEKVHRALVDIQNRYPNLIERIYTAEEVKEEERLSGDFWFVLEGRLGTLFMDEVDGLAVVPKGSPRFKANRASHGHHPSKGEKPPLIAWGPGIEPGVSVERGEMIDVCPTLAALMGVSMPQAVGKPLPIIKGAKAP